MTFTDIATRKGLRIMESGTKEEKTEFCTQWARKHKMPALEGTEKQVAWAEVLRIERVWEWIKTALIDQDQELANRATRVMREAADVKYWINTRFDTDSHALERWESGRWK